MTTDIDRGGIDVGGAHEPSYYEIALTNRQVVVAFVILLTCVVAAFFSGVWIGRESSARTQERLALLARGNAGHGSDRVDAMGNPVADKDKPEGQALQEFKFFADSHRHPGAPGGSGAPGADTKGTPAATEPASAAGSTRSADTATPSPAEAQRSRQAAAPVSPATSQATGGGTTGRPGHPAAGASSPGAAPAARAAAAAPGGGVAPADDTPAGEGEPLPASPAPGGRRSGASAGTGATKAAATSGSQSGAARPAAAGPVAGAGAATGAGSAAGGGGATASGEVVIQVFSTADREQADRVRDGLADAGFAAFLSPIAKGAQTMYRVRIGPFASKTDAEAVAEKVRKERKLDTWITPK
ncbi:MAG TPA: SPOR domain-containing protein [Thermoanaerobaculia bacterium]|nr:SPOR domain-containing protein [Thermoanaerobaculia bacterium]